MKGPVQPSIGIFRLFGIFALIGLFPIGVTYLSSILPSSTGPHLYLRFIAAALSVFGIVAGLHSRLLSNKAVQIMAAIGALIATVVLFQAMWNINGVATNRDGAGMFLLVAAFPLPSFILNSLLVFKKPENRSDEVSPWPQ